MNINIKIGGPAGAGVKSVGMALAKTFLRLGLQVFEYSEYPSLIRGGHNTETIHAGDEAAHSQIGPVDLLLALDEASLDLHRSELVPDAFIVYDPGVMKKKPMQEGNQYRWIAVPMLEMAKTLGNLQLMNTIGVGAVLKLTGLTVDMTGNILSEEFSRKGKAVVEANLKALENGFQAVPATPLNSSTLSLRSAARNNAGLLINGSEAMGLGAIAAGIGLYVAYPMTPASPVLHFMAAHQEEYGYVAKQPEDEIAAANMVLGAMHAGVRAMCGTSGGGFALMNETLALSGMTEIPLVMFVAQRPGPATGLPTWTEQGELQYAIHAGHGEFLRFVLAPGDPQEVFQMTADAFNLAERYQTPVILLSDKYLAESAMSIAGLDQSKIVIDRGAVLSPPDLRKRTNYQRYELTDTGISPRSLPGMERGVFVANSDEHDYHGLVNESKEMRMWQNEKRLRKFEIARRRLPGPVFFGPAKADCTLITWGSSKLPALQALHDIGTPPTNLLHFSYLWPLNTDAVLASLKQAGEKTLIIEGNATGQFEALLWDQVGFRPTGHVRKSDGRPIYPEEIIGAVNRLV